jgi:hypothetical protein
MSGEEMKDSAVIGIDLQQILNMVLPSTLTSKPLILNRTNGVFTIEWE